MYMDIICSSELPGVMYALRDLANKFQKVLMASTLMKLLIGNVFDLSLGRKKSKMCVTILSCNPGARYLIGVWT